MKVLGAIVGAGAHLARAALGVACLLMATPSLAQTPGTPKDTAAGELPWKAGTSDKSGKSEAAPSAATAAKAARKAADEAKAAAAEAKAAAARPSNAPAQSAAPPAATVTGSLTPPDGPVPDGPVAKDLPKTAPGTNATPDAAAVSPKIVLTPAKKLFGAAKSAAALPPRAIGGYAKGCVAGAQALAVDGPAWQAMRLSRNRNWGHPKLIALVERFATEMKTQENWPGLLVGDISQPRGGPMLTGHKSHQLGLDADIWFKPKPASILTRAERETTEPLLLAEDKGTEVIAANWNEGFVRLVKRAASYPEVERIFVHPAIKKEFCKAAGTDRGWLLKVRPIWLHNYHFHIRMGCPAGSTSCERQKAAPADSDGCGKELTDWLAMVSAPPRPAPVPAPAPRAPPPEMNLTQLPLECRTVLTAGEAKDGPGHKAIAEIARAQAAAVAEKTAKSKLKAAAKDKIKSAHKPVLAGQ